MDTVLIGTIVFLSAAFAMIFIIWLRGGKDIEKINYSSYDHTCLTKCPKRTDGVRVGSSYCEACERFRNINDAAEQKYVLCSTNPDIVIKEYK